VLLSIVPRGRVVTPDAVKETLETVDRPFATTGDVADRLDVTKQAIRNHHDELSKSAMLEHGKVGRQRVYWLADEETPAQVTSTPATPPPVRPENTDQEGEGVLDRLFSPSPLGDTAEVWALFGLVTLLGLSLGVAAGIALTHPSLSVASTAVFILLLAGTVFSFWQCRVLRVCP